MSSEMKHCHKGTITAAYHTRNFKFAKKSATIKLGHNYTSEIIYYLGKSQMKNVSMSEYLYIFLIFVIEDWAFLMFDCADTGNNNYCQVGISILLYLCFRASLSVIFCGSLIYFLIMAGWLSTLSTVRIAQLAVIHK